MGNGSLQRHIGIVLPNLGGGGTERATLDLAGTLIERGHRIDLVLLRFAGSYRAAIPPGLRLYYRRFGKRPRDLLDYCRDSGIEATRIPFDPPAAVRALPALCRTLPQTRYSWSKARGSFDVARYLREARPDLLISALPRANVAAILGAQLAGRTVPVAASVRNNVRLSYSRKEQAVARRLMPEADAVVAVSKGVAADTVETLGLDPGRVHTIYNPKPLEEIRRLAEAEPDHPWFSGGGPPIILSVLRNAPQKDWATLTAAFGQVRRTVQARLAILGDLSEEYRARIMEQAGKSGVAEDIAFLGFDENPYRYMRQAALFVLSSRWEGLPNVLIEAQACGTPVISTDAPYGPAEILEDGRWGRLTPVGDAEAMAQAILDSLAGDTVPVEALRRRAEDFSAERAVAAYELLIGRVVAPKIIDSQT
ncbi:MAG: glycosyltransferase [Rhodospirillaceae bacterium]|nr:glycosyltransferase [Rhodospirillaceae bacterium]MYF87262.1 glycosyltransferase [Rhodospirillaceae bacterium]MYH36177.1 glycosyltransferase [Rhodospirillaceae bacterium]MYK58028.1 glycosyltransferase [Rhodospirillaceae bacterium]